MNNNQSKPDAVRRVPGRTDDVLRGLAHWVGDQQPQSMRATMLVKVW